MDSNGEIWQSALVAMKELLSVINRQMNSKNKKDPFLQKAFKFVQSAITTLKEIEKHPWNALLNIILFTAGLVAQNLSSETAYNAVLWVGLEIGGLFDGSLPENIKRNNNELQHLLTAASAKMEDIHTSSYWLMEQVIKACESNDCSLLTARRLEAHQLRISADIRDCEVTVKNAHEMLEMLHETARSEITKSAVKFTISTGVALGLGFGASKIFQAGKALKGSLLSGAGVGCGVLCYKIAQKLGDYKVAWDEVNKKRIQYRQISNRLESLKATADKELQRGVKLVDTPDPNSRIAAFILPALLVAFVSVMVFLFINK